MSPLDGPRLKLRRAEKHLNAVKTAINDFIKKKPYTFSVEADPKPPNFVIIARVKQIAPDDELGVIIGDFAHNARSALDLLIYQLSKLPLDAGGRFSLQFPIFDTEKGYTNHAESYLAMVAPEHATIIEGFQPYNGVYGPDEDALGILCDINNTDKHRIIHVIGAVASFNSLDFIGPGRVGDSLRIGFGKGMTIGHGGTVNIGKDFSYIGVGDGIITKDRTIIAYLLARPPLQMNMRPNAQILVKFDESGSRVKGRNVVDTLTLIHDRVKEVIGKFEPVFE